MTRAKNTTVTKIYEGDQDVGGTDNIWSTLQQIAMLFILIGIGYVAVNWF